MAGHHGDCPLAMNGILPTWSSSSALFIILCSRTPRLYCLPSTTLPTDPSAIIPNYIATSRKPASPNLLPITANKLQMVCKTLNRRAMWINCCGCSHITSAVFAYKAWSKMKWNESGFRPPLCTYRLNWARRTSWGWWDDWDDTVLQTQDSKFEPWRSEAEHATSRSRRLPTILTFTRGWGRNNFVSFKPPRPGTEPRTLAWKAAVLTTTLGPPPSLI